MNKKWVVSKKVPDALINKFPEINPVILQLLHNRNIVEQKDIDKFLNPEYEHNLHDPFLFKDMKKATKRIWKAIEKKEKIVVHGDYDADGVCSSVIVYDTLKNLGADVSVFLPHREREGYGMNPKTVQKFIDDGNKLIITTDCGISNYEEVALAKKNGVDVVITDHHEAPNNLPSAYAILNPHVKNEPYPFKNLAGSGVAFKLASALITESQDMSEYSFPEGFEKWLLDMVAISTVTDIMPLLEENRVFVKYGLIVLEKTRRPGLKALMETIGNRKGKVDTFTIGYQIGPRINAAGRMDHAKLAFQLLTAETKEEAKILAEKLQLNNAERQKITGDFVQEAKTQIGGIDDNKTLLFAVGKGWPAGIIGLIAGKLADEYYRPTLILTEHDGKITGSGRSIREFNIVEALEKTQIHFERWGGHSQAGGFTLKSVENVKQFQIDFQKVVDGKLQGKKLSPFLEIEAEIMLDDVDWKFFGQLDSFQPFGEANPSPRFLAKGVRVTGMQQVGNGGKHLKLMITHGSGVVRKTIGFGFGEIFDIIEIGEAVDVVFEIGVNEWNGNRELELKIIDIKKSD
ncbi:MAG: single-stranded-DNA-specific exonuclease RecJ [Candidatus Marinimicrobia bacterium]|nr:single-stranded-DNA-specific exonuclease RecJ [Candidatus Neomarinimicrobiota bacterium]